MCLCIFPGRPFEDTCENTHWRKVKHMQLVWLCVLWSKCVEESFENTQSGEKSNKCDQCDYAKSKYEKSNKCNQCDFASCDASNLRTHLKTYSGEKLNKCNRCDYASSRAANLIYIIQCSGEDTSSLTCQQLSDRSYGSALCDIHVILFWAIWQ